MVREIETFVSGLTLYSTSVVLIGNDNVNIINEGDTAEALDKVKTQLHTIAKQIRLLHGYARPSKQKERLQKEVEDLSIDEYMKLHGIENRNSLRKAQL